MNTNNHSDGSQGDLQVRLTDPWSPADALQVVDFLEDLLSAIWDHHGSEMIELLQQRPVNEDDRSGPEPHPDISYDIPF